MGCGHSGLSGAGPDLLCGVLASGCGQRTDDACSDIGHMGLRERLTCGSSANPERQGPSHPHLTGEETERLRAGQGCGQAPGCAVDCRGEGDAAGMLWQRPGLCGYLLWLRGPTATPLAGLASQFAHSAP